MFADIIGNLIAEGLPQSGVILASFPVSGRLPGMREP